MLIFTFPQEQEAKIVRKMRATVDSMSFKGCPIVCCSAAQGRVQAVIECLQNQAFVPERDATAPFLMAVDHCFGIQGKGTVLTGKYCCNTSLALGSTESTLSNVLCWYKYHVKEARDGQSSGQRTPERSQEHLPPQP